MLVSRDLNDVVDGCLASAELLDDLGPVELANSATYAAQGPSCSLPHPPSGAGLQIR